MTLFFPRVMAVTKSQGELPNRGITYTGEGKICDFWPKSPFISETVYDMGPWLLGIANRKS